MSFINFKSLEIKNGRIFKHIKLNLGKSGLTSILGVNGVGKSTLWSILEAIIYGVSPVNRKRYGLVKNDKDASFILEIEKENSTYFISYNKKGSKWSHQITKDGIDETPHTAEDAVKAVRKLIGLTSAEFRGSVYLGQNSHHILIDGKPTERKEYISSFFNLDSRYDYVLNAAKEELIKIKDKITELSGLSHTRMMLRPMTLGTTCCTIESRTC